ncbi:putative transposase [Acidocella aminolytica 101 = DSM 11237]|nr:putative transposase [Acidocella aminolytica 101 = DSM 11237]
MLVHAGCGLSVLFRQALSARGLHWAVGIPRLRHVPDSKSMAAETMPADAVWRSLSWRRGTKGRLPTRFAALRVRVGDGLPRRIHHMGGKRMPGEPVWLVGEHRKNGERKCYLVNVPDDTLLKALAVTVKARRIYEQVHQLLKEEVGLDYFDGPSGTWLHRHALMTMISYAFLQTHRLIEADGGKRSSGPPPQPTLPAASQSRHGCYNCWSAIRLSSLR